MNQRRYLPQALGAIVRELDDKLTDLSCSELAEHHDHLTWLTTGAVILADLLIEHADDRELRGDPPAAPEPAHRNPSAWATDLYLTPLEHQRLAEIAERDYRGDLAAAASGLLGRAVREHAARVVGGAA